MRFLVDENLPEALCTHLRAVGHDAVHVHERGLKSASDPEILAIAADEERVLVSADSDFSALLAREGRRAPSLVFFRHQDGRRADALAGLLLGNLDIFVEDLEEGAVVVLTDDRIRIRPLPLLPAPARSPGSESATAGEGPHDTV